MAPPTRLQELETKFGDLHKVIPELVNSSGQEEAAIQLGCSQSFISRWLKDNGYELQAKYIRKIDQQPEPQS